MGRKLGVGQGARRGFTLVELLVVIGLIALLSAGLGMALTGGDSGSRLRSAEATAAGVFAAARAQAVLQGTEARVLVANDPGDPERYLRHLGVVFRDVEEPSNWLATGAGTELPEGVYFFEDISIAHDSMQLAYPRAEGVTEGSGTSWAVYRFSATGEFVQAGGGDAVGRFVLGAAQWNRAEASAPAFTEETPLGGFGIFPLGAVAFPENPEDLR